MRLKLIVTDVVVGVRLFYAGALLHKGHLRVMLGMASCNSPGEI